MNPKPIKQIWDMYPNQLHMLHWYSYVLEKMHLKKICSTKVCFNLMIGTNRQVWFSVQLYCVGDHHRGTPSHASSVSHLPLVSLLFSTFYAEKDTKSYGEGSGLIPTRTRGTVITFVSWRHDDQSIPWNSMTAFAIGSPGVSWWRCHGPTIIWRWRRREEQLAFLVAHSWKMSVVPFWPFSTYTPGI
jgi:hypothetical protein